MMMMMMMMTTVIAKIPERPMPESTTRTINMGRRNSSVMDKLILELLVILDEPGWLETIKDLGPVRGDGMAAMGST